MMLSLAGKGFIRFYRFMKAPADTMLKSGMFGKAYKGGF
jgi:hypothetical protein